MIGSQEWHGSNGEVAVGLTIRTTNHISGPTGLIIGITYGNLIPYNILRDVRLDGQGIYDRGR